MQSTQVSVKEIKSGSEINEYANYFLQNHRPWVTLKQNLSLDHHVSAANGKYIKLNSVKVRNYIQKERSNYQAIIVGSSTAIVDNPNLFATDSVDHEPIRIIIDRRGRILNNKGLNLLNNQEYETWIFTQNLNMQYLNTKSHIKIFEMKTDQLGEIIDFLAKKNIQSVYVEGGPTLEKAFMDAGYVNEIIDYFSPIYFGAIGLDGAIPIHHINLDNVTVQKIDNHIRVAGLVK